MLFSPSGFLMPFNHKTIPWNLPHQCKRSLLEQRLSANELTCRQIVALQDLISSKRGSSSSMLDTASNPPPPPPPLAALGIITTAKATQLMRIIWEWKRLVVCNPVMKHMGQKARGQQEFFWSQIPAGASSAERRLKHQHGFQWSADSQAKRACIMFHWRARCKTSSRFNWRVKY